MQIQNTHTGLVQLGDTQHTAGRTTLLGHVAQLGQSSQNIPTTHTPLNVGLPEQIQTLLRKAFAVQRAEILAQPSGSHSTRLLALDTLEQRGFQPAEGGLKIHLTGKGLGGAGNSPEWGDLLVDDDEDYEANVKQDLESWQSEVKTQEANILKTANELYQANQAITRERAHSSQGSRAPTIDARDQLEKDLSNYRSELREAKEQVRYYDQLLKDIRSGN